MEIKEQRRVIATIYGSAEQMNNQLISEPDLKAWLGFPVSCNRSRLEKHLRKQNIPIIYGDSGMICTTISGLNQAMGIERKGNKGEVEFV